MEGQRRQRCCRPAAAALAPSAPEERSNAHLRLRQPENVAPKLHGHSGQQLVQALGDGEAGLARGSAAGARLQGCRRGRKATMRGWRLPGPSRALEHGCGTASSPIEVTWYCFGCSAHGHGTNSDRGTAAAAAAPSPPPTGATPLTQAGRHKREVALDAARLWRLADGHAPPGLQRLQSGGGRQLAVQWTSQQLRDLPQWRAQGGRG